MSHNTIVEARKRKVGYVNIVYLFTSANLKQERRTCKNEMKRRGINASSNEN